MKSLRLIAQPLANLLVPSDMRPKTHFASRACIALLLSLLTFPLLASLAEAQEAQAPSPRESAAIAIAAQWLNVPENELTVVNDVQLGKYSHIKVAHLSTGQAARVFLNSNNRPVPPRRIEQVLSTRSRAGFVGKQEKALVDWVAQRPSTERTTVLVWTRSSGPSPRLARPGSSALALSVSAQTLEDFHKDATQKLVEDARSQGWAIKYQAKNAPVAVLRVPNDQIQTLEARSDVEALYLGRKYRPQLNVSAKAIDADRIWPTGYIGAGVKIAVIEVPDTKTSTTAKGAGIYFGHSNILDGGIYCNPSASPLLGQHATNVAGIIVSNNTTYRGIAYGAPALLSGNAASATDAEIMKCTEWALGQGADLINYSLGTPTTELSGLDQYADYIARNYSIMIVAAAGNAPTAPQSTVTSPGKGFNVLTVGNYDDKNSVPNSDDLMSPSSRYGDPASLNSDREKPEVTAPGLSIYSTCTGSTTCFGADSGTSLSAAHVTGCAALLMSASPVLKDWPEAIRAILMASAVTNIEGNPTLSEKDGAGGIECDSAYNILSRYEGGEWHGPVTSTSFPHDITFNATVGEIVRVAIAWDSNPDQYVAGTNQVWDPLEADLGLTVFDPNGTVVAVDDSWDNSYEIVEFPVFTTGVYKVRVTASRFEGFSEYLGVAWWQGFREKD